MSRKRVGRLSGFEYKGFFTYFLTLRTFARRDRFRDPRVVAETDRIFRDGARRWAFQFLAYCYMPDHLHLVVTGVSDHTRLVRFIQDARTRSGAWHASRYLVPLWQAGWINYTLSDEAAVQRDVHRVLTNPVRAGFVDTWEDWPYSGTESIRAPTPPSAPPAPRWSRARR